MSASSPRPGLMAAGLLAAAFALGGLPLQAAAQSIQRPQRAATLPQPSTDGPVLGGIKKGTDAAGRGVDRAGDATLSGVNRAADSASRPVRKFGNWLGDKLERGPGAASRRANERAAERQAP
ncbi:hypothetical protein PGB34_22340 [Xenophilus arseniciresistens]|uniref:Uncharacterized protein n=1 Tax=Xenophilus arseniciresistens TaxID=1283306 RepID=A0AAE3T2J2_9BURK|nr:hypothetical protein [Xenophilus arseniciresistens]MDA7419121.1 hypothetical protein [Xenophilus arseniciresistens]